MKDRRALRVITHAHEAIDKGDIIKGIFLTKQAEALSRGRDPEVRELQVDCLDFAPDILPQEIKLQLFKEVWVVQKKKTPSLDFTHGNPQWGDENWDKDFDRLFAAMQSLHLFDKRIGKPKSSKASKESSYTGLIDFISNSCPNSKGETLEQMWHFSPQELEYRHDFIQWMFPTKKKSAFNPKAAQLSSDDISLIKSSKPLKSNVLKSFHLICSFFELSISKSGKITPKKGFSGEWIASGGGHNLLRCTRILDCLKTLGFLEEARAFYAALLEIPAIPPESKKHFKKVMT